MKRILLVLKNLMHTPRVYILILIQMTICVSVILSSVQSISSNSKFVNFKKDFGYENAYKYAMYDPNCFDRELVKKSLDNAQGVGAVEYTNIIIGYKQILLNVMNKYQLYKSKGYLREKIDNFLVEKDTYPAILGPSLKDEYNVDDIIEGKDRMGNHYKMKVVAFWDSSEYMPYRFEPYRDQGEITIINDNLLDNENLDVMGLWMIAYAKEGKEEQLHQELQTKFDSGWGIIHVGENIDEEYGVKMREALETLVFCFIVFAIIILGVIIALNYLNQNLTKFYSIYYILGMPWKDNIKMLFIQNCLISIIPFAIAILFNKYIYSEITMCYDPLLLLISSIILFILLFIVLFIELWISLKKTNPLSQIESI